VLILKGKKLKHIFFLIIIFLIPIPSQTVLAKVNKNNDSLMSRTQSESQSLSNFIFLFGVGYHYADASLMGIKYAYTNGNYFSVGFEKIFGPPESREYSLELSFSHYFYFNENVRYSSGSMIPFMLTMDFKYYFVNIKKSVYPFVKIGGFLPVAFEAGGGFSVRIDDSIFLNLSYTYSFHTAGSPIPYITAYGANLLNASFGFQIIKFRKKH